MEHSVQGPSTGTRSAQSRDYLCIAAKNRVQPRDDPLDLVARALDGEHSLALRIQPIEIRQGSERSIPHLIERGRYGCIFRFISILKNLDWGGTVKDKAV